MLSLTQDSGFRVVRHFPRGITTHDIETTLLGPIKNLGDAIDKLVSNELLREIHILINGTPAFETAEVTVQLATSGN